MRADSLEQFIANFTDGVWNRGTVNVDAIDRYEGCGCVRHETSRPGVATLAADNAWALDLRAALSDLHVAADILAADAAMAVKQWTVTGFHTGTLAGVPPTNRRVRFSGVSIYRFYDGRIAEHWYVYDLFGLLQQLGDLSAAEASCA
jgi:predicted ester cyclase